MKKSKTNALLSGKLSLIALVFFMLSNISFGSVRNNINPADKKISNEFNISLFNPIVTGNPSLDIDKAKKEGKAVFLVITGTGAAGLDKAITMAKEANGKVSKSVLIQINRDDKGNNSLVTKLGIANVPVPFIMVISHKGVAAGGYPSTQATSDLLVKAVPSPKQDEVLFAISEKKPVYIVVSKKGLTDKTTVLANCKSASTKVTSKPAIVEFDINDSKESAFLKQIGITSITDKTITLVVNTAGQLTDKYEGIALESALMGSANKVIKSSGCAPGACGSGKKGCGK